MKKTTAKTLTITAIAEKVGISDKTARAKVRANPTAFPASKAKGHYVYDAKAARQVERALAA